MDIFPNLIQASNMASFAFKFSGWLLLGSLFISVLHGFGLQVPIIAAGIFTFIAALMMFHKLMLLQKFQVLFLFLTGSFLILSSDGWMALISDALTINYAVIAIIISVGFLRLIFKTAHANEKLPEGPSALAKTLVSVFVFASVINLSAIAIIGDRLNNYQKLDKNQIMILTRMFGACALWSPFFVSIGAALLYSGGANFATVLIIGLSIALIGLVVTGLQCLYFLKRERLIFYGYPMHIESLFIPALLTTLVLIVHFLFKDVSILIIVASVILFTVLLFLFINEPTEALSKIKDHIENSISNSVSEAILFLSAGVLAVGVSAYILTINYRLPIEIFDGYSAAITLVLMVLFSIIGVHPIISISVIGGMLAPISPDPDLLAIMFIFAWGVSIPLSPFSAISLLMQSRYQIKARELFNINLGYTLFILFLACLVLILYGN